MTHPENLPNNPLTIDQLFSLAARIETAEEAIRAHTSNLIDVQSQLIGNGCTVAIELIGKNVNTFPSRMKALRAAKMNVVARIQYLSSLNSTR